MTIFEEVEKYGLTTVDKKYLLKHLCGEKLTPMQTIHAGCYACMGYYVDGKVDCCIPDCPNYPFMRYNPNRRANKRVLTDKQRKDLGVRFKKNSKVKSKE